MAMTVPRRALLLLILLLVGVFPIAGASAEEFRGKVIGVTDADTIPVLHDRHPRKIRLGSINAPEKGQAFGERARQFTARLTFGQEVIVRVTGHDRDGRSVADVILADGRNLNRELVRAGYAWWFRQYSMDRALGVLEAEARAARSGLWADPRPIPLWEWRRANRTIATP